MEEKLSYYLMVVMTAAFLGCAGIKPLKGQTAQNAPLTISAIPIQERSISPGEVKYEVHESLVMLKGYDKIEVKCRDKLVPFYDDGTNISFFLRESYFSDMSSFQCLLVVYKKEEQFTHPFLKVSVVARTFPSERLNVDSKRVFLSNKDQERVALEQIHLNEVYQKSRSYPIFNGAFQLPMTKPISSHYGTKRIFNNAKEGQHLGTDFKSWVGSPVRVANTGVIVLARDLFYTGHTVIVDHGLGLFTVYGHLDKIHVSEGDKIIKGDAVGLSGRSGRVTGPHLHWGVKVNGEWVDGEQLIKLPLNSKDYAHNTVIHFDPLQK